MSIYPLQRQEALTVPYGIKNAIQKCTFDFTASLLYTGCIVRSVRQEKDFSTKLHYFKNDVTIL